jgi:glycosyltransferase involved in cell wall biosynthesis
MLIPIQMGFLSEFINNYIAHLPLINSFCLTTYVVASKNETEAKDFSVSIILPARNEAGNISQIVRSIPSFGKFQEIIFVEGGSNDDTWEQIQLVKNKIHVKNKKILSFKQKRKGKADAVRLGFSKSSGEILMIYDSDRTVSAHDLPKFYNVLKLGSGEFANGSRLVYPMEKDAMRILNKIGNNIFGSIFTWILGQRFKDTLCGTKAFFKSDYLKFKSFPDDPFGDFELIFGAIRNNLKVIEIPVRYKERVYGSTNIHRFKHGLLLLKMTWLGFKEFKAF